MPPSAAEITREAIGAVATATLPPDLEFVEEGRMRTKSGFVTTTPFGAESGAVIEPGLHPTEAITRTVAVTKAKALNLTLERDILSSST